MNHEGNNQTNPDNTSLEFFKKSMTYPVSAGEDVVKPELFHGAVTLEQFGFCFLKNRCKIHSWNI